MLFVGWGNARLQALVGDGRRGRVEQAHAQPSVSGTITLTTTVVLAEYTYARSYSNWPSQVQYRENPHAAYASNIINVVRGRFFSLEAKCPPHTGV